ncbi:MAG: thioredoxin domain-containing protein [Myxococcota bacterium]
MKRRAFAVGSVRGGLALALLGGVGFQAGCRRSEPSAADETFEPLPGVDDVDGTLTRMIGAERWPATYGEGAPIKGAKQPLVTIIEYSDFECPFCSGFAATLDELVTAYPDDVRIVFQQFPLPMHPGAEPAARAAIAAQAQRRFWAMHDRLFRERHPDTDALVSAADDLGLDTKAFQAALEDPATAKRVADEQAKGRSIGVRSTPNFFLNGRLVKGALPPERLSKLIESERKIAQQLVDAGSDRREVYARFMRAALDQHPKARAKTPAKP